MDWKPTPVEIVIIIVVTSLVLAGIGAYVFRPKKKNKS